MFIISTIFSSTRFEVFRVCRVDEIFSINSKLTAQEFSPAKVNSHFTPEANSVLQIKKSSVRWAKLIKKVYEVDPLKCAQCGETMKIIAFIMDATSIHRILSHIGEQREPPKIHLARGPPNEVYSEEGKVPEYQYDQTLGW